MTAHEEACICGACIASLKARVAKLEAKKGRAANGANEFLAAYCEAFKARHGTNPVVSKQAAGLAKTIVQSLGLERACSLVRTYLALNTPRYVRDRHALATFWVCITDIGVAHDTGKVTTEGEIRDLDRRVGNANAFGRLLGK